MVSQRQQYLQDAQVAWPSLDLPCRPFAPRGLALSLSVLV